MMAQGKGAQMMTQGGGAKQWCKIMNRVIAKMTVVTG